MSDVNKQKEHGVLVYLVHRPYDTRTEVLIKSWDSKFVAQLRRQYDLLKDRGQTEEAQNFLRLISQLERPKGRGRPPSKPATIPWRLYFGAFEPESGASEPQSETDEGLPIYDPTWRSNSSAGELEKNLLRFGDSIVPSSLIGICPVNLVEAALWSHGIATAGAAGNALQAAHCALYALEWLRDAIWKMAPLAAIGRDKQGADKHRGQRHPGNWDKPLPDD